MAIPKIDPQIMSQVLGGTKGQLDIISRNYQIVANNLEEIRGNQNDMMLALATIYDALKVIATKQGGAPLPEPRIDMEIQESKEDD